MPAITFCDLLDSAAQHVAAAEESRSVATPAADTIFYLGRLVTGAARCLRAVTATARWVRRTCRTGSGPRLSCMKRSAKPLTA
jgi:hypothetical protein